MGSWQSTNALQTHHQKRVFFSSAYVFWIHIMHGLLDYRVLILVKFMLRIICRTEARFVDFARDDGRSLIKRWGFFCRNSGARYPARSRTLTLEICIFFPFFPCAAHRCTRHAWVCCVSGWLVSCLIVLIFIFFKHQKLFGW